MMLDVVMLTLIMLLFAAGGIILAAYGDDGVWEAIGAWLMGILCIRFFIHGRHIRRQMEDVARFSQIPSAVDAGSAGSKKKNRAA